jgi:hypothetical protein
MSDIIDIPEEEVIDLTPTDRTGWGPGPWDGEPDRIEWEHAGRPCLMVRGPSGAWCGYAAVDPGHPFHGISYSSYDIDAENMTVEESDRRSPESEIDVHGGLTYSGACSHSVCHVPKDGQPADVWWFGFDTAHAWDLAPGMQARLRELYRDRPELGGAFTNSRDEVYRDVAYVQAQVNHLAEQLVALEPKQLSA